MNWSEFISRRLVSLLYSIILEDIPEECSKTNHFMQTKNLLDDQYSYSIISTMELLDRNIVSVAPHWIEYVPKDSGLIILFFLQSLYSPFDLMINIGCFYWVRFEVIY